MHEEEIIGYSTSKGLVATKNDTIKQNNINEIQLHDKQF